MNNTPDVTEVDPQVAFEQFTRGEVAILDVREEDEWELGHIEGAELVPMSQLQLRWQEIDRDKDWICVCRSGSRSYYAADALQRAGYSIANMTGGMLEWQDQKLPITDPGIVA